MPRHSAASPKSFSFSPDDFRILTEHGGGIYYVAELDCSRFHYISRGYETIWGRSRQSLYENPHSWFDALHGDDQERVARIMMENVGRGGAYSSEYRVIRPDGELRWVMDRAYEVEGGNGRPPRVVGFVEEITERKRIEEALRESEAQFRTIFENTWDGVLVADLETRKFVLGNPAICRMVGATADAITALGVDDIHPRDALPHVLEQFERQRRREIAIARDLPVLHRDGSIFYSDIHAAPIVWRGREHLLGVFRDVSDRRRAEIALFESREQLRAAFDNAAIGMALTTIQGRFFRANPALVSLFGYSETELCRRTVHDVTHPEDRARAADFFQRLIAGERTTYEIEMRYVRADGDIFWGRIHASVVRDPVGAPLHVIGMIEDVTARRWAEIALRESERRVTTLIANLPGFVYRCRNDRDWTMEFISAGCKALTDYAPEDFLERRTVTYNDLIHPEDQDRVWNGVQAALEDRQPYQLVYRIRNREGCERWVWEQGRGVFDGDGAFVALEGYIMDITDRKRAEEDVLHAKESLEATLDALPDLLFELDEKGVIRDYRAPDPSKLYTAPGNFLGRSMFDILPEGAARAIMDGVARAFASGRDHGVIYPLDLPNGTSWFEMSLSRRGPAGAGGTVVALVRDVTARKRADEERARLQDLEAAARAAAEAAVRARDEFLSIAAHEFKTPLAALQIQMECLLKGLRDHALDPARLEQSVEIGDRQVRRLIRLVAGLLDLTRISTGRFELSAAPCDLVVLVAEVLDRNQYSLERSGCVAELRAPAPVPGHWDRDRIEQIVENLLSNAMKFGERKPIELDVFADGASAVLRVRDHGVGIDPELAEQLFEPYERGSLGLHYGGLGMGLYIAREIVRAHGGHIRADQGDPDGAVITVKLPLPVFSPDL